MKTKHSIVAMSGAIMPLPLAMPVIRTGTSPIVATRVEAFGNVSVVMIPRAAASQPSPRNPACRDGSAAISFSCGNTSPITPVEATNTSEGAQPARPAAAAAVAAQASRPARPVKTLALPALTTTSRALPPLSAALHQSTGAPGHLFEVNTPAAVLPAGTSIITTSVRFWYRMPAAAALSLTPARGGSAGSATASGETAVVIGFLPVVSFFGRRARYFAGGGSACRSRASASRPD